MPALALKFLSPVLKYGAILLILWFAAQKVINFLDERDAMVGNLGKYAAAEVANVELVRNLNAQIAMLTDANNRQRAAIEQNQADIEKANEYKNQTEKTLAKHDIERLVNAKPRLIENIYNRGTADLFLMFEQRSEALADYRRSPDSNLPGSAISTTPEGSEP